MSIKQPFDTNIKIVYYFLTLNFRFKKKTFYFRDDAKHYGVAIRIVRYINCYFTVWNNDHTISNSTVKSL